MPGILPHEVPYVVRGYDCGYGGPLRVIALADMLQEAAGLHAEVLGVGMADLAAAGRTWMLARTDTRIYGTPSAGDTVVVRTWPAGTDKLFAVRDFEVLDAAGTILAAASYAYLIVDIVARRPLRPERILSPDMAADRPRSLHDPRYRVERAGSGFSEAFRERAMPRHIDNNGHVNNAHLIDWLVDAVPREARGTGFLSAVRVEFSQEVLSGEDLSASWAPLPPSADGSPRASTVLMRGEEACASAEMAWSCR